MGKKDVIVAGINIDGAGYVLHDLDGAKAEAKIESRRRRHVAIAAADASSLFEYCMEKCDSPIEQLFLAELVARRVILIADSVGRERAWDIGRGKLPVSKYPRLQCGMDIPYEPTPEYPHDGIQAYFYLQMPLVVGGRSMRLDAAVAMCWNSHPTDGPEDFSWIAIECDGHDYHERTKEQAASDRSRDRALTADGWRVARFTGSELFGNVAGCVDELLRIVGSVPRGRVRDTQDNP